MGNDLWSMLTDGTAPGTLEKLSPAFKQRLHVLSDELAQLLCNSDPAARSEVLSKLCAELISHLHSLNELATRYFERPPSIPAANRSVSSKVHLEMLEWARRQLNEEETVAGIREIRQTGGVVLEDFLQDLEREATSND